MLGLSSTACQEDIFENLHSIAVAAAALQPLVCSTDQGQPQEAVGCS